MRPPLPAAAVMAVGRLLTESLPGRLLALLIEAVTSPFRGRRTTLRSVWSSIVQQAYFTGVEAVPIITCLALLLGGVTIVQAATVMPRIGTSDILGSVMVLVILRELAPLFTAFLVAGRTGSALATYIGNMKVNNEIDALEAMGIDPARYLVLPALLGCTTALLCLSVLFSVMALLGGYLVATLLVWLFPGFLALDFGFFTFLDQIVAALSFWDGVVVILKPVSFGVIIALLACHSGLSLGISPHEVPQGTRRAVVQSFVAVVALDVAFAIIFVIPQLAGSVP